MVTSGAEAVKWRRCSTYTSSSGTFAIVGDLAGAPGSGVNVELYAFPPSLLTLAFNESIREMNKALFYPLRNWGGVIGYSGRKQYQIPRDFFEVTRVLTPVQSSRKYYDTFDRDNSTTSAGTSSSGHTYTISSGDTFGITSDLLYSVTDTDGDLAIASVEDCEHGYLEADLIGELNSTTTYRIPELVFRYEDANNYLVIRLQNGSVDLRKVDGGTESSITTATQTTTNNVYYRVRVQFIGTRITVWVDETEVLNHELIGPNFKYLGDDNITKTYDQIGFRLSKGGSPTTNARWRRASFHKLVDFAPVASFEVSSDKRVLTINPNSTRGPQAIDNCPYLIEGRRLLTALDSDTTVGEIASYTTERVELTLHTDQTELLVAKTLHHLSRYLLSPMIVMTDDNRQKYATMANQWLQEADRILPYARMREEQAPIGRY